MAIPADTVWEIRPTNGDNTFGGAFADSQKGATGVDYTQQTTAQLSLTDLATSGAGVTTLTSVTGGFTNLMLGNAIRINSGTNFQVGFYIITGYTDTNTVTLDRTPTSGGAGSGGNGKVGGATKSFIGQTTTTLSASLVAGNTVYVKNEAWNEAVTVSVAGTSGNPITIEGYNTSRGDNPTGTNRPLNNKGSSGVAFAFSQNFYHVKNLRATAAATIGFNLSVGIIQISNCAAYSNGSVGFQVAGNCFVKDCEAYSNTTIGFNLASGPAHLLGCYSHDNTTTGYTMASSANLLFCIADSNGTHGFSDTGGGVINAICCTSYGNTSNGWNSVAPSNAYKFIFNCIFASNTGTGMSCASAAPKDFFNDYNCVQGNGTAYSNITAGSHDSTANPTFTGAAGGDFSIGTNLKSLGWPGLFPGGTSTGYLDIGAVQRQEAAASSSTF